MIRITGLLWIFFVGAVHASEGSLVSWGNFQSDQVSTSFNLCFWNAHKFSDRQSSDDLIKLESMSDFVLIQEAIDEENFAHNFDGIFARSWGSTGVATLSSIRPIKKKRLLSNDYELRFFTPKVSLIVNYEMEDGSILLIANIHALNFVTNKLFKNQMRDLFDQVKEHQGPMILAGDFNTWNEDRIQFARELFAEIGLREINFFPERPRDPRLGFFGLLDRAFSRGFLVTDREVLGDIRSSDHIPSCACFKLN